MFTRVVLATGVAAVVAFIVLAAIGLHELVTPLIVVGALALLVGSGNLLYGRNSHGAIAQARVRPAQEAQNRAIDEAQREDRLARERARAERRGAGGRTAPNGLVRGRRGPAGRVREDGADQ